MKDWRLENKTCKVHRFNGGWSNNDRTMTLADALAWFSKYGYKAARAWDLRSDDRQIVIGRQIVYRKPNCVTEYTMTIKY